MLAVRAGRTPKDLTGLGVDLGPVELHRLAVGLHGQLLEVGRETGQAVAIGQDGVGLGTKEISVPGRIKSPAMNGRFDPMGAVVKWTSMVRKPASISAKCSGPIATIDEKPMAESYE